MCGQLSATLLFKVQPIVNVLQKKFLWEKKKSFAAMWMAPLTWKAACSQSFETEIEKVEKVHKTVSV